MIETAGVVNEFGCPVYMLTNQFTLVHSSSVASCVSFVHECDSHCVSITTQSCTHHEHEQITVENYNSHTIMIIAYFVECLLYESIIKFSIDTDLIDIRTRINSDTVDILICKRKLDTVRYT